MPTNSVSAQEVAGEVAPAVEVVEVEEGVVVIEALPPAIAAGPAQEKNAPLAFLKPLINSEISFIKRVCEPTDEQMTAIIAAATQAYNATGDMVRDPNQRLVVGNQVRFLGPGNEQLNQNPYRRVQSDAAIYLQPIVTEDQYARYQIESKQRDLFERSAVVGLFVELINAKIAMTEQQQADMKELMMGEKDDMDIESLQVYVQNPQVLPKLPDLVAEEVFTMKQLAVWKSLNAPQVSFSSSVANNPDMSIDEEWIK